MTHALVTGFPASFLAQRIVRSLLAQDGRARVTCVVQERFRPHADAFLAELDPAARARVSLLEGDAAALDLGLSGAEVKELVRDVTLIHHAAAITWFGADPKMARAVNVGGTREVIELAEIAPKLERLVHWSTALVSGTRRGYVLEDELVRPPDGFRNAIEETRFRAERIVRQAAARLPVTILRPSMIVGDSSTGEIDRFEGPYLLVLLLLNAPSDMRLPLPGRGDLPLHLVPVDWVVEVGTTIARDVRSAGRTFHIVDPSPIPARRVFEIIAREAGRPLPRGFVPAGLASALLRIPGLGRITHVPRAFLDTLATEVVYDARNTDELLAGKGLPCPPFESYAASMVRAVHAKQADRRARGEGARGIMEDPLAD